MIGQYLSNTNENATVLILQNFLQLNKAQTASSTIIRIDTDLSFDMLINQPTG